MTVLRKKRVLFLLFIVGVIALSITAEKCRNLVGKEAASKSGDFTLMHCFDGGSGTLACLVKESVKLYSYNIRSLHVETRRNKAIETALADALSQGMNAADAAKAAQKEGAKAAKLATRKVKRIVGPIISSGWDFFEALYFGGTMTEGFLRGTGTLIGTYSVGFVGEERFGRFGYLIGSQLGSWIGGTIGLMVYDVVNGIHCMTGETRVYGDDSNESSFEPDNLEKSEVGISDSNNYEAPADESIGSTWSGTSDESNSYEIPAEESIEARDEF